MFHTKITEQSIIWPFGNKNFIFAEIMPALILSLKEKKVFILNSEPELKTQLSMLLVASFLNLSVAV